MTDSVAVPQVCQLDFLRRSSNTARRWTVLLAGHLSEHTSLVLAYGLLADMRAGKPLDRHFSPMKKQRAAFKRAHKTGVCGDYRRFMDHILNK